MTHRQDVQPGDRVWFRLTGSAAGIYAVGRITSIPRQETNEFGNWHVDVSFDYRIDPPLLRPETDADPVRSLAVSQRSRANGNEPGPVHRGRQR
jgi:hypothetical protein